MEKIIKDMMKLINSLNKILNLNLQKLAKDLILIFNQIKSLGLGNIENILN